MVVRHDDRTTADERAVAVDASALSDLARRLMAADNPSGRLAAAVEAVSDALDRPAIGTVTHARTVRWAHPPSFLAEAADLLDRAAEADDAAIRDLPGRIGERPIVWIRTERFVLGVLDPPRGVDAYLDVARDLIDVGLTAPPSDVEMGIAWTAHEFRSPLLSVRAALAHAKVEPDPEARDALIERCHAELTRLAALVQPLLTASVHPESIERDLVDVVALVRDAIEVAARDGAGEAISFHASDDAIAWVEPRLLEAAVLNLVRNGQAYSNGEPIDVRVERDRDHVRIVVADRGRGIRQDEADRLFEPFVRGERSVQAKAPGTGLGLYLTRRVVEAHGGRVTVDSRHGGAVFAIEVPVDAPGR